MNRKFLQKRNARSTVQYALQTSKLKRPSLCERCGLALDLEFHHWHSYDKNNYLTGWWLCKNCHREIEKQELPEQLLLFPDPIDRLKLWN